jgi:hypothetical protein
MQLRRGVTSNRLRTRSPSGQWVWALWVRKRMLGLKFPREEKSKKNTGAETRNLLSEQIPNGLFHDLAAHLSDGHREGNVLRTDLDAVLGVSTLVDAAIAHQG